MMKKIKFLIISFLAILICPLFVNAASGSVSISGIDRVVKGNKITVTVTLSSSTSIGSWSMSLDYDSSYLKLTSSSAEAGGNKMANVVTSGIKSKKYTFTFQAQKTGTTTLKIGNYEAYAFDDMSAISLSPGSKQISIITQEQLEASYSKDNNLKALAVEGYEITPEFNKDTLEYSVTVPEGTTMVNVIATKNDGKASLSGDGEVQLIPGTNEVSIVVKAENGSEKTYKLIINVIDQNPINVKVNNIDYTVVKLRDVYQCPNLYTESEVTINDIVVPACHNDKTKYTLVGLKSSDGTVKSFIYENGKYTKYNEVIGTSLNIIVLEYNGKLNGLKKYNEKIDGNSYQVFKSNDNSKFYIVYGMNVATGKKDFYVYDTVNKTFGLYDSDMINNMVKLNKTYFYVIVAFGIGLLLALICIIKLSSKKHQVQKENSIEEIKSDKKKIKKEEKKPNDIEIVDEDENTETYNILEEDKKRKRRKK